jgi:hypothetical protein
MSRYQRIQYLTFGALAIAGLAGGFFCGLYLLPDHQWTVTGNRLQVIHEGWEIERPCALQPLALGTCKDGERHYKGQIMYLVDAYIPPETDRVKVRVVHTATKAYVGLCETSGKQIVILPAPGSPQGTELELKMPPGLKPGPYELFLYVAEEDAPHTLSDFEWRTVRVGT